MIDKRFIRRPLLKETSSRPNLNGGNREATAGRELNPIAKKAEGK
jgi:hypothetical protein